MTQRIPVRGMDPEGLAEFVRDTVASALVAGTNVTITVDDTGDTITLAAAGGGGATDPEVVRDTIAAALVAGSGISISVDDAGDTITITNTGGGGGGDSVGSSILLSPNQTVPQYEMTNGVTVPARTIVYEEAVDPWSAALALSPVIALSLDETSGNFADSGSNGAAFTPGTGVTRGKPALFGGGYSVAGPGAGSGAAGAIASLASNPASLAGGVGSLMAVVRMSAQSKGTIIKMGGSTTQGWSLDIGSGVRGDTLGRDWIIGRNGVTWVAPNVGWNVATNYVAVLTRDAAAAMALWLNGTRVWTATGQSINTMTAGGPMIGNDWSTGSEVLSSTVDMDCAVWWGRVLTDSEIASLGTGGGRMGAKGWWDGSTIRPLA